MLHLQILLKKEVLNLSKELLLKTSEIETYPSVHEWLKERLSLSEHYGANLDALWDELSGNIQLPLTILWHDDANVGEQYTAITELFEEAAGEIVGIMFGYLLDDEQ